MSISTYSELQTAITNWLRRGGDTDLVDRSPDLIDLAEAQFNRDLKHRSMETTADLTLTGSVQTVALPADFIEARSAVVQTTPLRVLSFVTPTQLDTNFADGSSGVPSEFSIIGSNMKVGQIPDSGYTIELTYYQQIPALSDSNTTNWLLTSHPDMYLYAALLQAAPYMSDDERIPVWGAFYDRAREGIKNDDNRAAFSGGPLTTRVNVYTG
tara:strand:- start:3249 stop:3884 length:636 start_codon:yes stop_codon:yes gene_type:complete